MLHHTEIFLIKCHYEITIANERRLLQGAEYIELKTLYRSPFATSHFIFAAFLKTGRRQKYIYIYIYILVSVFFRNCFLNRSKATGDLKTQSLKNQGNRISFVHKMYRNKHDNRLEISRGTFKSSTNNAPS